MLLLVLRTDSVPSFELPKNYAGFLASLISCGHTIPVSGTIAKNNNMPQVTINQLFLSNFMDLGASLVLQSATK